MNAGEYEREKLVWKWGFTAAAAGWGSSLIVVDEKELFFVRRAAFIIARPLAIDSPQDQLIS